MNVEARNGIFSVARNHSRTNSEREKAGKANMNAGKSPPLTLTHMHGHIGVPVPICAHVGNRRKPILTYSL